MPKSTLRLWKGVVMSSFAEKVATIVLVLSLAGMAVAPAAQESQPSSKEEIAKWIKQLGDDSFAVREKATELLWKAGKVAESDLKEAARSRDLEIARRARELLDKFKWGVYPDTPKTILDRIKRYQSGDYDGKQVVVRELVEMGSPGCTALIHICSAEEDAGFRQRLFQQIIQDASRAIPILLPEGNLTALERLLELSLNAEAEGAASYYAAYWLLRGKIDDRIAHFKAQVEQFKNTKAAIVLTHLYRAKGDLKNALEAARQSKDGDLIDTILYEMADWKALANSGVREETPEIIHSLGLIAVRRRLAGNKEDFDKTVNEILKKAAERAEEPTHWLAAKVLFLNDRPKEALELCVKARHIVTAFEVLCAQLKYDEAFKMQADNAREYSTGDSFPIDLARGRALYNLGKKELAQKTFAQLFDKLTKHDVTQSIYLSHVVPLLQTEYRLGLKDDAFAHCANLFANIEAEGMASELLGAVFPGQAAAAEVWWRFLRQKHTREKLTTTMQRLRDLLDKKKTGKELEALVKEVEQAETKLEKPEREKMLLALAEACLNAGLDELGKSYLERAVKVAGSFAPLMRLGDYSAEKKLWKEAAEHYRKAAEENRIDPLPVYLRGWCLSQAGQAEEGKKLIDLAHWLPLANEAARLQFADALTRRGHTEAARWERELVLRTCVPGAFYAGEALRQLGFEASAKKDYLKAANYLERAMHRCMHPNISFADSVAYVGMPYHVHRLRALGLLTVGKVDEALQEIQFCQTALPAAVDLPIQLVPELEKHGRKKEAQALFDSVFTLHEKWCQDYPQCALAHNNLAWLAACCRRQLDKALEHSRKAVELTPEHAGHRDTLAEVLFQRGDKDKAVEQMKKCIELEPKNAYFRQQLKRFEAGDPRAPLPDPAGQE